MLLMLRFLIFILTCVRASPMLQPRRLMDAQVVARTQDGRDLSKWPQKSEWLSWKELKKSVRPALGKYCTTGPDNSPGEDELIFKSIDTVVKLMKKRKWKPVPDRRFILAVIMQESTGCLRVGTTALAHANPGIMQSHKGSSCFGRKDCGPKAIQQMILDGANEVSSAERGLRTIAIYTHLTLKTAADYYKLARFYNSGEYGTYSDINCPSDATPNYSQDIARRLVTGWTARSPPRECVPH